MTQRVLLIAYYWPPSGGAGVQRWLKMTYYLAEMGVEVHVLTVDPDKASYPDHDESLMADVHPDITVHKTNSFEPINLYASLVGKDKVPSGGFTNAGKGNWKKDLVMRLRTHLFIPDPRKGWQQYAVPAAQRIMAKHDIPTVITTSTPQSVHLIGRQLKRKLGVRWIADFRDPWTDIYYYPLLLHSRFSAAIDKRLEASVFREADHLTTVSNGLKKLFLPKMTGRSADDITIIPNGFDPRDFMRPVRLPPAPGFTISYTGTMSDQYAPGPLLEAIAAAIRLRPAADIRLEIVGKISDNIEAKAQELGIPLSLVGTVPHAEVNDYQRRADMLLLALPQVAGGEGILTGKLFEYLAARRPILALGMFGADVAGILAETGSGQLFVNEQVAEMTDFILATVDGSSVFAPNEAAINRYSRVAQAEQVKALL